MESFREGRYRSNIKSMMPVRQPPPPPAPRRLHVVEGECHIPDSIHGFYLVWNPQGRSPKRRHPTLDKAQAEAERLSQKHPNKSFYVLKTVTVDRTFIENVTVRKETDFSHEHEVIRHARRCY